MLVLGHNIHRQIIKKICIINLNFSVPCLDYRFDLIFALNQTTQSCILHNCHEIHIVDLIFFFRFDFLLFESKNNHIIYIISSFHCLNLQISMFKLKCSPYLLKKQSLYVYLHHLNHSTFV